MALRAHLVLEDLLFVTYALPPGRLRPLVPASLTLDTVLGPDGRPIALLSVVAFLVREMRVPRVVTLAAGLPQLNFRVYVLPHRTALYFLRSDLGPSPVGLLGGVLIEGLSSAPLDRWVDFDESTGRYRDYVVRSANPAGHVELAARSAQSAPSAHGAPPGFATTEEACAFVTERPTGYASLAPGGLLKLEVRHPPLHPTPGELLSASFRRWDRLGILSAEEARRPHSVFLQREAVFEVYVPLPVLGATR